ncbi:hypothetical protein [Hydrogenophaga sp. SL48]|uniref:hypothetical protein n=1 Tax=Hydrogenophaga sp. SL48 TaxID=2806347 RepID=UPI001F341451|nr:hypothetical protein [Hydrogenophaga sp. SL48]UJW80149.1 hypothetical protein IM738_20140 [Hydrogenophaga sp. SL48]
MKPLMTALAVGALALMSMAALHAAGPSLGVGAALQQQNPPPTAEQAAANPFGVASSASSSRRLASWIGPVAEAGVGWVRGFSPTLNPSQVAQSVPASIRFSGILEYRDPADPAAWQQYVRDRVQTFKPVTRHWEIWNEPPNFTPNTPPEVYGQMVALAHDAAKGVDPTVQVGLAAQSVNLNYLDRALLSGAKDKFDFITVHPYETAGLIPRGFEAQYMAIVPTIRKMLRARNPERAQVPVYFTEVGQPIDARNDETAQASQLLKVYTMGLAQGAARVHWFEPLDGDSGPFGLIGPQGRPRPAHTALRALITHLGPQPRYVGWLLLADRHHGFLFDGPQGPVLVAWSQPGTTAAVALPAGSRVVEPLSGGVQPAPSLALNNVPSLALLPRGAVGWTQLASANQARPFPWNGDHSGAKRIEFTAPGGPAGERGLHLVQAPVWRDVGTERVLDAAPRAITAFTVDPNFLSYSPQPLRITAVVRRNSATAAGFNLKYESRSGTRSLGWNAVPAQGEWSTLSWPITDAQFVGKFGYHFSFDSDSTRHSNYSIRSVSVSKE